ncbi:MAG TPA: DUF1003 domain-containing protein [Flavobacterium sp.]|jgi:uncharacterized membrane protein
MSKNNNGKAQMSQVVERNINVLLQRKNEENAKKSTEERIADKITRFTGSMLFVYLHLLIFGIWILWNSGVIGIKPFDASFVILAMFASVEAIFLSTFVLISQNRMNIQADKRADLALQITLLTEHELTKLITIVHAMAQKLEVPIPDDTKIDEITKDIHPEKVMDIMEDYKKDILKEDDI